MPLDANGNVVITKVPSVQINVPGWKGVGVFGNTKGLIVNGKPIEHNYNSPSHGAGYITNYNPAPTPPPTTTTTTTTTPSNSGGGSSSSSAHPMSAEFIEDTYDPELSYENSYNSPGDNPYISTYTPPQFGYMNDPSTLSPKELDYRAGNIKGLDDRQNTVENAGALLNNYIFSIKEELNKTPEMKVGTIGKESDDESDELYGRSYKESPYDKYDSSKYY